MVPVAKLEEVDRYILARHSEAARTIPRDYEEYGHGPFPGAHPVRDGDPERLYNDISQDRLTRWRLGSHERRSAQTGCALMADG
jgi:hypothetical protein